MGRLRGVAQATALGFAVERDTLAATLAHFATTLGFEHTLHSCCKLQLSRYRWRTRAQRVAVT